MSIYMNYDNWFMDAEIHEDDIKVVSEMSGYSIFFMCTDVITDSRYVAYSCILPTRKFQSWTVVWIKRWPHWPAVHAHLIANLPSLAVWREFPWFPFFLHGIISGYLWYFWCDFAYFAIDMISPQLFCVFQVDRADWFHLRIPINQSGQKNDRGYWTLLIMSMLLWHAHDCWQKPLKHIYWYLKKRNTLDMVICLIIHIVGWILSICAVSCS